MIRRLEGPHLLGGGSSLFRESGGRGGVGAGLWSWVFLGRASSLLNVVYCVEKVDLVPGSTVLVIPDRTQQSWPSRRPTLRRMIVFLNTTISSARIFSSELKQGTRERSGLGAQGSKTNLPLDMTAQRTDTQYPVPEQS